MADNLTDGVEIWLEAIGSMNLAGASPEHLFDAVPEAIRASVEAEWDRRWKAYEELKAVPIEEIKAEVLQKLRAYRIRQLQKQVDELRAEVAALRAQVAAMTYMQQYSYPPWWHLPVTCCGSGSANYPRT